jgi:hypothetical protein
MAHAGYAVQDGSRQGETPAGCNAAGRRSWRDDAASYIRAVRRRPTETSAQMMKTLTATRMIPHTG